MGGLMSRFVGRSRFPHAEAPGALILRVDSVPAAIDEIIWAGLDRPLAALSGAVAQATPNKTVIRTARRRLL